MSITPVTREEKILSGADIQPRTRMEYFLKKASENGGGSESGLPPYNSEDENKILTVKHVVEETIWVPEQTIEVSNEYAYDIDVNFDKSDLRVGLEATAVFTVFGMDMSVQCYVVDDPTYGLMWEDEEQTARLYLDPESNKWTIHANDFPDGTYTGKFVSIEDKGVVPVWEENFKHKILESNLQLLTMFQERLEAEIPDAIANGVGIPKYHPASGVAATDEDAWDTMLADIENAFNNNTIPLLKMDNSILQPSKLQYTPEETVKAVVDGIRFSYGTTVGLAEYVFNMDFSVYLMINNNLSGRKEYGLRSIVELTYQSGGSVT